MSTLILYIQWYKFNIILAVLKYERIIPSTETCIHRSVRQPNEQFEVESLKDFLIQKSFELTKY